MAEKELCKEDHIKIGAIAIGQRTYYIVTIKKGPLAFTTAKVLTGVPHILTGPHGWPHFTRPI